VRRAPTLPQDLRDQLLAYKRRDLQDTLLGRRRPATFGALMFSDMQRGQQKHGEPGWESSLLAGYLPVPISGMLASGAWAFGLKVALAWLVLGLLAGRLPWLS